MHTGDDDDHDGYYWAAHIYRVSLMARVGNKPHSKENGTLANSFIGIAGRQRRTLLLCVLNSPAAAANYQMIMLDDYNGRLWQYFNLEISASEISLR